MPDIKPHLSHPKYRPDIDGLRAVAVLAVVTFHAFPTFMKGGFIGVDVFFVISGYLISSILFENLDRGTLSFAEFYSRRIRRIFPALIMVLLACFAFGWFALLANEYKQLGKYVAAAAGFVSNLVLWADAGYFDNSAETKPLLHLWSLGIEEQFYIVWPLFLWLAWKGKFNLLAVSILIATISFLLNLKGVKQDTAATFYSPQTRFWELIAGSLLGWVAIYKKGAYESLKLKTDSWLAALVYRGKTEHNGTALANALSMAGIALMAYGFWRINKDSAFPGGWALIPVTGSILIIAAGPKSLINRRILANKIAVWFGLISYPLYLWHWPLLSFARIIEDETPCKELRIGLVLVSIALAWITYKYIESPIRIAKHSIVVPTLIVAIMILGSLGGLVYTNDGIKGRDFFTQIKDPEKYFIWPEKFVLDAACEQIYPFYGRYCVQTKYNQTSEVALIGDSHANHLFPGIADFYGQRGYGVLNLGVTAPFWNYENGPISASSPAERNNRLESTESILNFVSGSKDIKLVILGFREAAIEHSYKNYLVLRNHPNLTSEPEIFETAINETLLRLTASGKRVAVLVDVPNLSFSPTQCTLGRRLRFFSTSKSLCSFSRAEFDKHVEVFHSIIARSQILFPNVIFVPLYDYICDDKNCSIVKSDSLLYRDDNHLSVDGSLLLGKFVGEYINSAMANRP